VDAMAGQFAGMSVQPQGLQVQAPGMQGSPQQQAVPGAPQYAQRSPANTGQPQPQRSPTYSRPIDSSAAPYVPAGAQAAADPYGAYPPQPPAQYGQYQQQKPMQGYGAPQASQAGYGHQQGYQQAPMRQPPAQQYQQGGYTAANSRYPPQQQQAQGYAVMAPQQQGYDPQQVQYDSQYFGSSGEGGAAEAGAAPEHSS
jgi:hypothetical protein